LLLWRWDDSFKRSALHTFRLAVVLVLLAVSGAATVLDIRTLLAQSPHEVREGGLVLRAIGSPGEKVMARKPHVAYYAGMDHVPMPSVNTIVELIESARAGGADYLFFSGLEANLRRQFLVLSDSAMVLPGLRLVEYRDLNPRQFFALYRVTDEPVTAAAVQAPVIASLERYLERNPDDHYAHSYVSGHMLQMGRYEEALQHLEEAERLQPGGAEVARFRSMALFALGRREESAAVCEAVIAAGNPHPWFRAQLAQIRLGQGRLDEAREHARMAVEGQPANVEFLGVLGLTEFAAGDYEAAASTLERALRLEPGSSRNRLVAGIALAHSGRPGRALELLEAVETRGTPEEFLIRSLADSLRATRPTQ
jgi:tetratricopeptide (TPR) repeat protein